METWNQRLARALAESEYNANQLAQKLSVKPPSVSAWLGSGSIKPAQGLSGEYLLKVCRLLNIRPEWLMFREGPMRPPPGNRLSQEMQELIALLEQLDAEGGAVRDDAIYFMNRLLRKEDKSNRKVG